MDRRDRQQRRPWDGPARRYDAAGSNGIRPHLRARGPRRCRPPGGSARREDRMRGLLSWTLWIPLGGAIVLAFVPRTRLKLIRGWALLVSLGALGTSLAVLANFDKSEAGFQLVEHHQWIRALGASYHIGVD